MAISRNGGGSRLVAAVLLPAALGAWMGTPAGAADAAVRVAGLRVVGPGLGANGSEVRAFREEPGITLALAVSAPAGKSIIEIDDDGCVLESLTNDQGRDLLESADWGPFPEATEDGRAALVEVTARSRPTVGAAKVRGRGSLAIVVAAGRESEKVARFELTTGRKIQTRRGVLEVLAVSTEGGVEGATVTFGADRRIRDELADIRFLGDDGAPIDLWGRGSMTMGSSVQLEYSLSQSPKAVALELDWWQGLEELEVPFEVEVGLGL